MAVQRFDLEVSEKRSDAKVLRTFDYRKYVSSSDVIVSSIVGISSTPLNVVPASTNLTISGTAWTGKRATVFFEDGTTGESYLLIATALLSDGQRIPLAGILKVIDRVS